MNNRELKFRAFYENKLYIQEYCGGFSYFIHNESTALSLESVFIAAESGKCIIQQYTGLKDKNGKEIYEGDFVKYNPDDRTIEREGIIEWSNYYHGWTIRDKQCYPESNYGVFSLASPFMSFNDVEIICHIFENPELLKTNE
jgi:uncharacterized phage protein (TIGR01671 family)